ncbi:hypothetical protein WJX73_000033 [Symbiochloris irregularis]|uniref:Golgi apparatus membrane protein TVP23 n=1 Tax=Symbiochloris irregularis TaxID=706552 RepID=A0AAW1PU14_9CHLO
MSTQAALPQEPAYGHPVTAFTHVFFKVAGVLVYIFCGLSNSFVANFVAVVVLLMFDFWITKNISGRLLVGLRWWNEVTDEGSNWRFESLEEGQRTINKKDSACFWWSLYAMPLIWLALGILAILRSIAYLLIIAVAVVLTSANVIGFVKCSKSATKQLKDMATAAVTTGLTAAMSRV